MSPKVRQGDGGADDEWMERGDERTGRHEKECRYAPRGPAQRMMKR